MTNVAMNRDWNYGGQPFPFLPPVRQRGSAASRELIFTHKSNLSSYAIPKGLCPPAQGFESASYLGKSGKTRLNPNRVAADSTIGHNPVGVGSSRLHDPKVARASQPWAPLQNPFRIPAIPHAICRKERKDLNALFFSFYFLVTVATAGDWPRFLGSTANGISTETGLLDSFQSNSPALLWEKNIGTGYSAPSVRDNLLVLHHRIRNEEIVECFRADSGKSVWRYAYPSLFEDPYRYSNGPRCTPLLTSNRCYTFGAEGKLVCLDLMTGKLVWQRDTGVDWNVPAAFFGVGSSPLLESDKLLVMVGGQPDSGMVAFDPQTGKTLWESIGARNWEGQPMVGWPNERKVQWQPWEKQASYATPVACTIHGQRHVLCLMRQGLVSVNPTNGQVNFSFWFRSRANDSVNAMSPVVSDDLILISAAYYQVGSVLLRVKPGGKDVEEVWRSTVLEIHWNTPILHEGYLYAFSGRNEPDANFRCVEYKTGKLMWERDERWPPHSTPTPSVYGRGSAIMADGKLIILGEGGLLGLFKINPNKAEEISRFQVPQMHHPCWAAPVLSRKRLYLRSEDHLVCFNFAKP